MKQTSRSFLTYLDLIAKMTPDEVYTVSALAKILNTGSSTIQRMLITGMENGTVIRRMAGKVKTYRLASHTETASKPIANGIQHYGSLQGYDREREMFRDLCMMTRRPLR